MDENSLMTLRFLIWFLLFGSFALPRLVLSQDKDETETGVMVSGTRGIMARNGRSWKDLDRQSKIMLLVGIQEGVTLLLKRLFDEGLFDEDKAQRVLDALTISGFRFSDIVKQIDLFYSDSANVRIPVLEADRYSLLKMKGKKTSDLEQVLVGLRQTYNQ